MRKIVPSETGNTHIFRRLAFENETVVSCCVHLFVAVLNDFLRFDGSRVRAARNSRQGIVSFVRLRITLAVVYLTRFVR